METPMSCVYIAIDRVNLLIKIFQPPKNDWTQPNSERLINNNQLIFLNIADNMKIVLLLLLYSTHTCRLIEISWCLSVYNTRQPEIQIDWENVRNCNEAKQFPNNISQCDWHLENSVEKHWKINFNFYLILDYASSSAGAFWILILFGLTFYAPQLSVGWMPNVIQYEHRKTKSHKIKSWT